MRTSSALAPLSTLYKQISLSVNSDQLLPFNLYDQTTEQKSPCSTLISIHKGLVVTVSFSSGLTSATGGTSLVNSFTSGEGEGIILFADSLDLVAGINA